MSHAFRLSRVRTPRCSPGAAALIVTVFLLFGLAAEASRPVETGTDRSTRGAPAFVIGHWLPGR